MNNGNVFKILFFVLLSFFLLLVAGAMVLIVVSSGMLASPDDRMAFMIMGGALVFAFTLLTIIGRIVYKDAGRLGMNPWMWLSVVVFLPNAIGVIIYLIVRANEKKKPRCPKCQTPVREDFALCPRCGHDLKGKCPACGKAVESDWNSCPYCGSGL